MSGLIYNGVELEDFGVHIDTSPYFNKPAKKINKVSVPGRNGDLILKENEMTFENLSLVFPCFIRKGFAEKYDDLVNFLALTQGYNVLECDKDPATFREAVCSTGWEPETGAFVKYGKFNLTFDCKPQRFLKSGTVSALSLSSNFTTSNVVAQGKGKDIFSSAFLTSNPAYNTDEEYTVISFSAISGSINNSKLKFWFPENMVGTHINYCITNPNPTTGYDHGLFSGKILTSTLYEYNVSSSGSGSTHYFVINSPIRWELWQNNTLLDGSFKDSGTVFNPTGYEAKPLIHLTLSSAVSNKLVACVNEYPIIIKSPTSNILPNSSGAYMTDVYIDCETMNAYMPMGEANYNLNPYVTIPREIIALTAGENEVFVNGYIDSIEIIPRWWKL